MSAWIFGGWREKSSSWPGSRLASGPMDGWGLGVGEAAWASAGVSSGAAEGDGEGDGEPPG